MSEGFSEPQRAQGRPYGGRARFQSAQLVGLPDVLSGTEIIRALDICAATYYQWLGAKRPLPSEKVDGQRVIQKPKLVQWLKRTRRM